jgi:predicted lipoprotein with Yx(FWY)xxD motif
MSINTRLVKSLSVLLVLGIMASACKDNSDPGPTYAVQLSEGNALGNVLIDGEGRTLYYFANDFDGKSSCNDGTCLNEWPVFHHNDNLPLGAGLNSTDFATITRTDGAVQTTYKGWPLYYYAPDEDGKVEGAGRTLGQGVDGLWFVMKNDYAIMYTFAQLVGDDGNNYKDDFTKGDGFTKYISDAHGRTLYLWTRDKNLKNNFTNADYTNTAMWSLFYADLSTLSLSGSLLKTDFAEITVGTENRKQLTYKGYPLYQFVNDTQRGNNKGVSIPAAGPLWRVLNAATPVAPAP